MKNLIMDCRTALDALYAADDSPLPLIQQARIWLHLLLCPACAAEARCLRQAAAIMKSDFLPPSPDFGDLLMSRLREEGALDAQAAAAVSFRGWVIIGCFVLLSLSSAFFGMNFIEIANAEGLSFLVPVGITFGVVLTCYGAIFIGSNLKELSARFGLR